MLIKKIIILFIVTVMPHIYAEETWKIASLNWEPYSGSEIKHQGKSIQKLRELLNKEGITLIVEFYPWKRAKHLVKTEKDYLGIFPAWPEDVFDGAIISPAIDWSEIAIIKLSDSIVNFDNIDKLFEKYPVGIVSTYIYPQVFTDAISKYPHNVAYAPDEYSLLKKLAAARNTVAITDPKVMQYLAYKEGISNLEVIRSVMQKELVLAFRDDEENRKRLELLTRLIKESEKH